MVKPKNKEKCKHINAISFRYMAGFFCTTCNKVFIKGKEIKKTKRNRK